MFSFQQPTFEELTDKEWIITNSLGGYASSTLAGCNTRRYHGLLVAPLNPPSDRLVLVSKVEELIFPNNHSVLSLATNQYPGVIHPQGYLYIRSFNRVPLPSTAFSVGEQRLAKTVFMVHGSNTTVVEYRNTGKEVFRLRLSPLYVHRDYHGLQTENAYFDFYFRKISERTHQIYAHYGAPAFYFSFSKGEFLESRSWYRDFEYAKELYRGLDYREDSYCTGHVECLLQPEETVFLIFSLDPSMWKKDPAQLKHAEIRRLEALKPLNSPDPFFTDLAVSGDQFLIHRQSSNSSSLMAGYHWFTDWGRDTMIAMRGLCLSLGKKETAESILRTFLKSLDRGMLPNRFPDQGENPEYNTIDATLWLFVVLYEYYERFEDLAFIQTLFEQLTKIVKTHISGTRYDIHVTPEGLLFGGEGFSQLTWMDARIGDYVVTPRQGCPVEINALWYNALMIYRFFAKKLGYQGSTYEDWIDKIRENFRRYFWNPKGYLNDVIIPGEYIDPSVRPNQIYAVSLPFPLLDEDEEKKVVQTVHKHLYTDLGLRTLSPSHPDFKESYGGDPWQRDTAYHQGTVWPFLIGEYFLAYLKVNGYSDQAKEEVLSGLGPLKNHFYEKDCIYGISEIFDGLHPGPGRGACHQAWSVGMLLKVLEKIY